MKSLIYEVIAVAGAIDLAGNRILKPFGLTPMTFNILNVLDPGPLSQREISERIIVVASSITFQVRQLQKKGFIQRRRADARTWRVSLTAAGRERLKQAAKSMDQLLVQIQLEPGVAAGTEAALQTIRSQLPGLVSGLDGKK